MLSRNALVCALMLSACNTPGTSDMPGLDDEAALKATILKLDPIAPGGNPSYTGQYGMGQPQSDRGLFTAYLKRYLEDDLIARQNIDYKPAPLARTVAEAIEDQRRYEARQQQRQADEIQQRRRAEAIRQDRNRIEGEALAQRRAAEQAASNRRQEEWRAAEDRRKAAFQECDRQREAAQAKQPLEDGYATYRSFECEHKDSLQRSEDIARISNAT